MAVGQKVPFAIQSYKHPSLPISAQQCVNMYAEQEPKNNAKNDIVVLDHPGLVEFTTCGSGPIRGMRVLNGVLYVVSGGTLYSVTAAGVSTPVGSVIPGTNMVGMSDNGAAGGQLIIVNGPNGYIYQTDTGFQPITDLDFLGSLTVIFFDNYFVLIKPDSNQYYLSDILDGSAYLATNIASADGQQGNLVAMVNQQNTLYLFGQTHMEAWYDAGNADFPFLRIDGATIERGCIGAFSVVKEDNAVFFLGDDRIYYRIDAGKPVRISTHAIEFEWNTYKVVDDVYAYSYTYGGHKFIVVTFKTEGKTWVYDISTNLWHQRVSWDINNNSLGMWRANCTVDAYGKQLFGDAFSGKIGLLDPSVSTEYGNTVQAFLVGPPLADSRVRIFFDEFELDMETGVGATTGQGKDPMIILDWSDDGGRTWSQPQQPTTMGKIGEYRTRVRWTRLGWSRVRYYRVRISDPVRRRVIAAHSTHRKGSM